MDNIVNKKYSFIIVIIILLTAISGCRDAEYKSEETVKPISEIVIIQSKTALAKQPGVSTKTSTKATTKEISPTPTLLPPPGEYIAYLIGKKIQLISLSGIEMGTLMSGASEGRNWLSPNQEIIAYSDQLHIINFKNIYTGEISQIHDKESCKFGVTNLSWNPDGNEIVLECGYSTDEEGSYYSDLKVLSYPEGEIQGRINKIINYDDISLNYPIKPSWSTDGRWIIFFINAGMKMGIRGLFITDTTCLFDDQTCPNKTILRSNIENENIPMSWLPNSNLAVLDTFNYSVNIFKLPNITLLKTITIPENTWGFHSLAWSHNDEWFAIGSMDGIFIISSVTSEVKQISKEIGEVLFWIEIQ